MREILFRARTVSEHLYESEWVEGFYTRFNGEEHRIYTGYAETDCGDYYPEWFSVIPETVGQFTGLTDKNGKRIYEGDIIKSCEYDDIYFVKYFAYDNYPAFDVVPEMNIECNGLSHLSIVEGIEVIGNIHDNPELLERRNENAE